MYPIQSHEIRAMRKAQALHEAQRAHIATAVRLPPRSIAARLANLAMPGKASRQAKQSYAPTPC